ncbi:MAG: YraN family protein [Hungatella sp.]
MKPFENKRAIGSCYENLAAAFLEEQGYEILERNYRDRRGEIDLIARDGRYLVFIEVKYRKNMKKGYPEEAVTPTKQQHIHRTAEYYLYRHAYEEALPCRFDVVSILGDEIRLIQDAF